MTFIFERVTRIELVSPAWKAGALATVLYPQRKIFLQKINAAETFNFREIITFRNELLSNLFHY